MTTTETWGVSELSRAIAGVLGEAFEEDIWVQGEITGFHFHEPSGHTYFTLVEKGASADRTADKIPVALFENSRLQLEDALDTDNLELRNGIEVRVSGRVGYYAGRSQVQLYMSDIDLDFALGQLAAQRSALLKALQAEGLLDKNRQLSLPVVPLRVGLVTSASSAAAHDFLDELQSSGYAFQVTLCDVRVQGETAVKQLAATIQALGTSAGRAALSGPEMLDVIAVVRGGGSSTDLIAFDTEAVARAIANCELPVVVGIGHEIDEPVADRVAHTAYKTPTACSAALVERVSDFHGNLEQAANRLARSGPAVVQYTSEAVRTQALALSNQSLKRLKLADSQLARAATRAQLVPADLCRRKQGQLSGFTKDLANSQHRISRERQSLNFLTNSVVRSAGQALKAARSALESRDALINSHDLDRILARGFSITRHSNGAIVRSLPKAGDELETTTQAGLIHSTVKESNPPNDTLVHNP